MRLAIFQGPAEAGDVATNLRRLKERAEAAAADGARLLVCPEMFLTGYNIGGEAAARLAEPVDGPSLGRAKEIASGAGIALLFGYPERGADGHVYNSAAMIERDGRILANARKCHLFSDIDRGMFRAHGLPLGSATLDGFQVGILICYDVEFPEIVRAHALAGSNLVLVPTALMEPYGVVADVVVPARAFENQVFVAYANRAGREGDLVYCGRSCVVAPDGADLARAGRDEEIIFADLDPERLQASRALNTHLRDRRPELYGQLVDRHGGER
jgi:predicted amidohydrolase